jgi:hypothetical protein
MSWTKLIVVLAFVVVAAGHTNAQPAPADPRWSYFVVGSAMTVTIKKGAEELATINFPRGVHVAVSDGTPAQVRGARPGGYNLYQGTVEVYAKLPADVQPGEASATMRNSTFALKVEGVEVRVVNRAP